MNLWQTKDKKLYREFKFKNFLEAQVFVNKVSTLAEEANHHPDICFGWGYVKISLYSYDVNEITDRDIELAKQISKL